MDNFAIHLGTEITLITVNFIPIQLVTGEKVL